MQIKILSYNKKSYFSTNWTTQGLIFRKNQPANQTKQR